VSGKPDQLHRTITVREGLIETVTIPELDMDAPAVAKVPKQTSTPGSVDYHRDEPVAAHEANPSGGSQRVWGLAVGGVGLVAAGVGTVFGLLSMSAHEESQRTCVGAFCNDEGGVEASNQARAYGNISTAAFIVAGVGVAVGATLLLTAPSAKTQVTVGLGGLQLGKKW
jgi:hypothetical protein